MQAKRFLVLILVPMLKLLPSSWYSSYISDGNANNSQDSFLFVKTYTLTHVIPQ